MRSIPHAMSHVEGGTYKTGSVMLTVSSFWVDEYQVTYELWTEIRNWGLTNGYTDLPEAQNGDSPTLANNPVTKVNWYDALKWCNARSEREGLTPAYYTDKLQCNIYKTGESVIHENDVKWTEGGYRLPTEAEWEFASRGGTRSKGYKYSGSNNIEDVAWYNKNSNWRTHAVGEKKPNELGIYDMSGNISELCWDWYNGARHIFSTTNPKGNPTFPRLNSRVVCGGGFNTGSFECRVINTFFGSIARQWKQLASRSHLIGFRPVKSECIS